VSLDLRMGLHGQLRDIPRQQERARPVLRSALLIGIDAYSRPLAGCVNDVDAIAALLVDRLGMPTDRILRVESPNRSEMRPGAMPATLHNLEHAFVALEEQANAGDWVFIYYSGHSLRTRIQDEAGDISFRGGLVPVDFDATSERRYLYDHDLDRRLSNIVARGCSVTFMLDCAHAAAIAPGWVLTDSPFWTGLLSGVGDWHGDRLAVANDCHVIAACLDHEISREVTTETGVRHGVFTHSFLRALRDIPDSDLPAVRWSRIWQAVCDGVMIANPYQHPWMSGSPARAIFAGPSAAYDLGFSVRRVGHEYEIGAGTLASVTASAVVAVYGDTPACFPPRGSNEDRQMCLGLLRVTQARGSTAIAIAEQGPFNIPPGARCRLIEPSRTARLRCALVPPDTRLAAELETTRLLEIVDPASADVLLQQTDQRWVLSDLRPPGPARALVVLEEHELYHAREVFERYCSYSLPERTAARAACDLPSVLDLAVLLCPDKLLADTAQHTSLPEAPRNGMYELQAGARMCLRVRNRSPHCLRVTLLNSAASGTVQILGDRLIEPGGVYVCWAGGKLGKPFVMTVPTGKQEGIDRLVAIGTTLLSGHPHHFAHEVDDETGLGREAHAERWTATQVIVRTSASPASTWASVRAAAWWSPPRR
jgi:hypothetical protein